MSWKKDDLVEKGRTYFEKAFDEDRESPFFGLWCSFALELSLRACVAAKSPLLLAAPDSNGLQANLMVGLGLKPFGTQTKSVETGKVIDLCRDLHGGTFTKDDGLLSRALVNRRNEELHTGTIAFEAYGASEWLSKFYLCLTHIAKILQVDLQYLVGDDEAEVAIQTLGSRRDGIESSVHKTVGSFSKVFGQKTEEEQEALKAEAQKRATELSYQRCHKVKCPACESDASLLGTAFGKTSVTEDDGEITTRVSVAPDSLKCEACGLRLSGYSELEVLGLAGHYTRRVSFTPEDYFGLVDPDDIDIDSMVEDRINSYREYDNE